MKKTIVFSILVLGISSVVGQLLVIRELTVSFYGNEFFIGWILFSWLFWVGMGSIFLNKIFKNNNQPAKLLVWCHVLVAVFLPLEIFLSRISRILISGPTGQIPNLIPGLIYGFFMLAPICLLLGLQFAIFSRFWKSLEGKTDLEKILGKSYVFEAIGFVIGGLIFSYVFILFNEFLTASILAWLNLMAVLLILFLIAKSNLFLKYLTIILAVVFVGIAIFSQNINYRTNTLRFPNQKLIETKNSPYGNIAVTETNGQYNFYESGLLIETSQEGFSTEEIAHLPLLFHREPQKILLIGNGINGTLKEILKHWPNKVFYLELDPKMIVITEKYASPENRQILDDERIKIINADARNYFKKNPNLFDVIIVNLPNPSTALINRFYSEDFFKDIKTHLYPYGIFMVKLSLSANYFGPEIENLDNSVFKALKNVFPSVLILPEDNHLFIGSLDKIDYDYWPLYSRIIIRDIQTNFINEAYLKYRLNNDRIKTLLNDLETNQAQINRDQKPIGYYYNFVYWISIFYPKLAKFFQSLTNIKFIWIIIFIFLGFLVLFPKKRENNTRKLLPFIMATAGFSLMVIEIIILFGFQVFYGYLYYKISLIIALLMAGMALGGWLAFKNLNKTKINSLIKIHCLIILFSLLILLGFNFLFSNTIKPSAEIEIIFLLSAMLIGAIVGFEFPIVNKLYLENKNDASKKVGIIYGADLIGSCLGASLVSIFLLPIFGIYETLIILGILNFLLVIYLMLSASKTWAVKT